MANASNFQADNEDLVINDYFNLAASEIFKTYGHKVTINRKTLHKFGRNSGVGTSETDVNYLGIDPVHSATNSIDTVSSENSGDTTQTVRVEGFTIDGAGCLKFVVQNVTLNGQNKVTLATPVSRVTRIANTAGPSATLGDVWVYEDGAITNGIPNNLDTVGNVMPAEDQSTLFAGTSIACNNYFICTGYWAYLGKKTAAYADIRFKTQTVGLDFYRTLSISNISNYSGIEHRFAPYFIVPPNTDIDITAVGSTTGIDVFAGFDGFFADIVNS